MYTIREYHIASSLEDAAAVLDAAEENRILAGGMWLRQGRSAIGTAIDLSRLGLDRVETDQENIRIGAMASLRTIETDGTLRTEFGGILPACVAPVVGVQFRNTATLGGSVWSRFGFSDPVCALLSLDTTVELYRAGEMPLEAFLKTPPKRDILIRVRIRRDGRTAAYRSMRRTATDFALLNLSVSRRNSGGYAVCVGARPDAAVRCPAAEACLEAGDRAGASEALRGLKYGTNLRASEAYRRDMASVLLEQALEALEGSK